MKIYAVWASDQGACGQETFSQHNPAWMSGRKWMDLHRVAPFATLQANTLWLAI